MNDLQDIRNEIKEHDLRITPQRVAVLEAVYKLGNHPTTDEIVKFIKTKHPNLAIGTVYKTLEMFSVKGLVRRVKTENDIMRYDAITEKHHHLYSENNSEIGDYYDPELDQLLENYFNTKNIPGFRVKDVRLQIVGEFKSKNV